MIRSVCGVVLTAALLAGCNSKQETGSNDPARAPGGPKTALNEAQFSEVVAKCQLGSAVLRKHGSDETVSHEDNSTTVVTITFDGPANQKIIVLPTGISQEAFTAARICLKGEFERLGAEAKLLLPKGMGI